MKLSLKIICLTLLASSLCYVFSCKNPTQYMDYDEIVFNITNVRNVTEHADGGNDLEGYRYQRAVISFTLENTGSKTIEGWRVYFDIHLSDSRNIDGYQKKYYTLKNGEISPEQTIRVTIPDNYGYAIDATITRFDVW